MNNMEHFDPVMQEKPINWREIIEKYLVYWKWIAVSALVFLILGFVYLRKQPYVYQLSSTLLVVDQSRSGGVNEFSMLRQLNIVAPSGAASYMTMVNNENEVMKSTTLMKRVVNELDLFISYNRVRFWRTIELYKESPYVVNMDSMSVSNLNQTLQVLIKQNKRNYIISGIYGKVNFEFSSQTLPVMIQTPAGPLSVNLREGYKTPKFEVNVILNNPATIARHLASNVLSTEVNKQVDVIKLSVKTNNIQKGRDLLNTLIYLYNQDAIDQVNRSANNTALFIDNRLKLITSELSDVEEEVEIYKQTNQMTDVSYDAQLYLKQNSEYEQKSVIIETQLSLIRFVEDFIKLKGDQNALIPNLGLTDVGLVVVINSYNELIMTRERISGSSSEINPTLQRLNTQIDAARLAILNSVGISRKGLEIQRDDIKSQNFSAIAKIRNLPRQEREFIEIKRQQQVKENLYLFLLQKREEASLTMAVTVPKGRLLNAPDSHSQVGPRTILIMSFFFVAGFLLPILVLFVFDILNTKIVSRNQIETITDIPILSELGHNESGNVIIDHSSNIDSNAELFRLLRTKLQFILDFPSQKVLLITSTEPGEGKSYVSINLGISLSLIGKKVILLGLDLRKPQLKRNLNLINDEGLSSFLSGHELNYKTLVQKIPEYPGLDIITSGVIPPNPNELLISDRLELLMNQLRQEYDYIVIDTAPVGAVSDTFLIDRVSDIALYVLRMNYSDKRNLEYLNHVKNDKTLKRPFIVINDMNLSSKYYYHRGYSYGYGKYYGGKKSN